MIGRAPMSSRREFARDTRAVVDSARKARESLVAVVKLCERRRREVVDIGDTGLEQIGWERLSDGDRVQSLHMALTWLQQAERQVSQTRTFLERAIEHAERRAL